MIINNFNTIVFIWIITAVITFLALIIFRITVPYGRHSNGRWGKTMDNRLGWFIMELPALLFFPAMVFIGPAVKDWKTVVIAGMWVLHYFNRTAIFPFRLKTSGKRIPLLIVVFAFCFNMINSFLNGFYLGFINHGGGILMLPFILGLALYSAGFFINTRSDKKLIALREKNDGYKIPYGRLFKYISCPNHFGEIVEWTGFAIAAWNLPALSFAVWSFCNLAPRALNHHKWYKLHFSDYPPERSALIPFVW